MRVAVYYAPTLNDPLWPAGCTWLGRDPETATTLMQPPIPGLPEMTASPRRYGFHATLKPPMRLQTPYAAFIAAAEALAATLKPFPLPPLAVVDHKGFLALRETRPSPELQALADACVAGLDDHRAPPTPEELARRRRHPLPPAQDAMLERWGYPHVFETWFFHMTLSRRLSPPEREQVQPQAAEHFSAALPLPRQVDALTIYTEAEPGSPFLIAERLPFQG